MKKIMVAIISLSFLAVALPAYETESLSSEAKYYDNAKVIRIKNIEGEGFVQRSYEEGYEEATPNLPVFEKDSVGTTAGRLGIYLGRLNYLRLDSDTMVQLLNIPQLRETDLIARVEKGAIYLDIENLDKEKSIQIQTPDCAIFILDKGIYRINVAENSITEVYVIEGIAEVAGQDNSRNVRENQKIVMSRGQLEERPYYFYASEKDDFDRWNETQNREQGYARYGTSRYLQSGYEDYEYEMSRSGRWSYMSDFNSYVWTPYYSNADWMPYANGRWVYNPFYGYVWTSYDNCGWFTHHYGRWHWSYSSGWYWIPGYHWSPAWVSWFGDNDYYGWSPLSWWNRPVIIINNHWDRNYNYRRGIPHHSRSTIIIRKNQLTAVNAQRVAISRNNQGSSGARTITYRGSAPSERLAVNKVTVINARGKTMAFKQNGIVSSEKYKISRDAGQVSHSGAVKAAIYKYNPPSAANNTYSPRVYRSKDVENKVEAGSGGYIRSKTSNESSATTRARSSDNSRSRAKSETKAGTRDNSASSSNSSSSTSGSTSTAKKKKDGAAYTALLQSENSAGYKSHATGSQSGYSAANSSNNRRSYRAYGNRTNSELSSSRSFAPATANRYSSVRKTAPAYRSFSDNSYASPSEPSANRAAVKERSAYQNHSTTSSRDRGYGSTNSNRGNYSSNQTGRSYQATRSANYSRPSFSASARSSGSSTAARSSSSSTSTRTARKKN